jgi:c-di-GMP-binding flagellar brake protein YcgR
MRDKNIERRKHSRYPFPEKINYVCGNGATSDILRGITVNISDSGMCLYLFKNHREGQEITILSDLPIQSRKATIRWINNFRERFFTAGIMFS